MAFVTISYLLVSFFFLLKLCLSVHVFRLFWFGCYAVVCYLGLNSQLVCDVDS